MPFTLVGFTESQDSAALIEVAALADQHVRVVGDDIIVPALSNLAGAYALGPNVTQAQLSSPSLRRLTLLDAAPVDVSAEPTVPAPFLDMFDRPFPLDVSEALNALAAEDAAGASRSTVLAWLIDAIQALPAGPIFTVRVTNTTTLTANAWTNGALTFGQTLPAGAYAIVGAFFFSAGLQAFRFVFPGGSWRPGAIGFDAVGDADVSRFRMGAAGVWGQFEHDAPPTVDFLSNSADSSQTGYVDLIQVRAGSV